MVPSPKKFHVILPHKQCEWRQNTSVKSGSGLIGDYSSSFSSPRLPLSSSALGDNPSRSADSLGCLAGSSPLGVSSIPGSVCQHSVTAWPPLSPQSFYCCQPATSHWANALGKIILSVSFTCLNILSLWDLGPSDLSLQHLPTFFFFIASTFSSFLSGRNTTLP